MCGFVSMPWVCKHKRTAPLVHRVIVGGLLCVISQESGIMEASVTSVGLQVMSSLVSKTNKDFPTQELNISET